MPAKEQVLTDQFTGDSLSLLIPPKTAVVKSCGVINHGYGPPSCYWNSICWFHSRRSNDRSNVGNLGKIINRIRAGH